MNRAFRNKLELLRSGTCQNYKLRGVHVEETVNSFNKVPLNVFGAEIILDGLADIALEHRASDLLLGVGFLKQFVSQISYPNKRIQNVTHGTLKMSKLQNIDCQRQKGSAMPIVKIGLGEGKSAWMLFDTGSNSGLQLNKAMADSMGHLSH